MTYKKSSVNGDAGEYFAAYKFTRLFGWPCRLYGVDIGIDHELEVLDNDGVETGNVIKIQVKSFDEITATKEHKFSVHVEDRHIRYWKSFCVPVIICAVDLKNEIIYWKSILSTHPYLTRGDSRKVTFCTLHDILNSTVKEDLRALVVDQKTDLLQSHFETLYDRVPEPPTSDMGMQDYPTIDGYRKKCDEIDLAIKEIKEIISYSAWRIGVFDWRNLEAASVAASQTRGLCGKAEAELANGG